MFELQLRLVRRCPNVRWAAWVVCACITVSGSRLYAGPSVQSPYSPLEALGIVEGSKELVEATNALTKKLEQEFIAVTDSNGLRERTPAQKIESLRAQLEFAWHDAWRLQCMLEPAGHDLMSHISILKKECQALANQSRNQPPNQRRIEQYAVDIRRGTPKRQKLVEKSLTLAEKGEITQAYEMLEPELNEVRSKAAFYASGTFKPETGFLLSHAYSLTAPYEKAKREQAFESYRKHLATETFRIRSFVDKLPSVIEAILAKSKSNPSAAANTLDLGIEAIAKAWESANATLLRYQAVEKLLTDYQQSADSPPLDSAELSELALVQIARLIKEGGTGLPADQNQALYSKTLRRVAGLVDRSGGYERIATMDPATTGPGLAACIVAINGLRSADALLNQQSIAYHLATDQLLRWRFVQNQATISHRQTESGSKQVLGQKSKPPASLKPDLIKARGMLEEVAATGFISQPVHWQLSETYSRLKNQSLDADRSRSIATSQDGSRTLVSLVSTPAAPESSIGYFMMKLDKETAGAIESHDRELLLSEDASPMTLAASLSKLQMTEGHLRAVGGTVESISVESASARLTNMNATTSNLLTLQRSGNPAANFVGAHQNYPPETKLIWRFSLAPSWYATDFYMTATQR